MVRTKSFKLLLPQKLLLRTEVEKSFKRQTNLMKIQFYKMVWHVLWNLREGEIWREKLNKCEREEMRARQRNIEEEGEIERRKRREKDRETGGGGRKTERREKDRYR